MLGSKLDIQRWVKRRRWDLQRFGITPQRLLRDRHAPRIVSISMPKAGTHLLERALCLHPDLHRMVSRKVMGEESAQLEKLEQLLKRQRPGQLICGHIRHSPEVAGLIASHGADVAFIVRDPRDVVVSHAHYIESFKRHEWNAVAQGMPDLSSRIEMFIDGGGPAGASSIADALKAYAGWLDEADAIVRFEQMVGPKSGPAATAKLFDDLGVVISPDLAQSISGKLVSPVSVTFRKGKSGGWREEMNDGLQARLEAAAGEYLSAYGYG